MFFFFISYMGCHPNPIDFHIFQRGRSTTNQTYIPYIYIIIIMIIIITIIITIIIIASDIDYIIFFKNIRGCKDSS